MTKYLNEEENPQALYQGRWVNKDKFRAYVYNGETKKLANSYKEYADLIESGLWFSSADDIKPKHPINIRSGRKTKNGANS